MLGPARRVRSTNVSRRTKIVCTLGPATATPDRIRELVEAGMDVARLNFSHGDREDHKRVYDMIRAAADSEGHAVGILADLQGPKIRLGRFADGPSRVAHRRGGADHRRRRRRHPRPGLHHVQGPRRTTPARTTGC